MPRDGYTLSKRFSSPFDWDARRHTPPPPPTTLTHQAGVPMLGVPRGIQNTPRCLAIDSLLILFAVSCQFFASGSPSLLRAPLIGNKFGVEIGIFRMDRVKTTTSSKPCLYCISRHHNTSSAAEGFVNMFFSFLLTPCRLRKTLPGFHPFLRFIHFFYKFSWHFIFIFYSERLSM